MQGSLWNPIRKRTTTFKKHMIKLRNKYSGVVKTIT